MLHDFSWWTLQTVVAYPAAIEEIPEKVSGTV